MGLNRLYSTRFGIDTAPVFGTAKIEKQVGPVECGFCEPPLTKSSERTDGRRMISISARSKYVEALGRIIIGGPYPPSNAIIYIHLQL